jgi:hypothetical protein
VPQNWLPLLPQVSATQPAFTHTLLVQAEPAAHAPQSSAWPQPSPMLPQNWVPPAVHVAATQLAPPTHRLLVQDQSLWQFMPQSSCPLQPSPITPQYWPPSGVQDTDVSQVMLLSGPPSGKIRIPLPAVPVEPALVEPEPAVPLEPPLARGGPFAVLPLEQLATATTAATYTAPVKTHFSIFANARRATIDHESNAICRTFRATEVLGVIC